MQRVGRMGSPGLLGLLALVLAASPAALATAGFAEWEVYTPGGHVISHSDLWKEQRGDVLRSDTPGDPGEARILVSHLERWRYYPGHVAGRNAKGWFLFDETSETVERFASERLLQGAIAQARLGEPLSPWLTGADGWREAWFPFMIWRPCRALLAGEAEYAVLSAAECRDALKPEWLALYRVTTWGRLCDDWAQRGLPDDEETRHLVEFCEQIRRSGGE